MSLRWTSYIGSEHEMMRCSLFLQMIVLSVRKSVCHGSTRLIHCKNGWTDQDPRSFLGWPVLGPKEYCVRWGPNTRVEEVGEVGKILPTDYDFQLLMCCWCVVWTLMALDDFSHLVVICCKLSFKDWHGIRNSAISNSAVMKDLVGKLIIDCFNNFCHVSQTKSLWNGTVNLLILQHDSFCVLN